MQQTGANPNPYYGPNPDRLLAVLIPLYQKAMQKGLELEQARQQKELECGNATPESLAAVGVALDEGETNYETAKESL